VQTTKSSDALISWSAEALIKHNEGAWPTEDLDVVLRVNASADSRYDGGPSVRPGEAYYVSLTNFKEDGIDWQIIVVQKAECNEGDYVSEDSFTCIPCISPETSSEGASKCEMCIKNYYYDKEKGECKSCPLNKVCEGLGKLPYPAAGFWAPFSYDSLEEAATECSIADACIGGCS
jgi:hypothetical protein